VDSTRRAQIHALGQTVAEANRETAQAYHDLMQWAEGDQDARGRALALLQSSAKALADVLRQASWL
jgi:hypothetical protein